jgi:thioredoxin-related protein
MRRVLVFLSGFALGAFTNWRHNLDDAKQIAQQQHKHILLNFSGSDWCGPCIRMHKEIFNNPSFQQFADTSLVMVNADFPRNKKNQLSKNQQQINNAMADKYNANGNFPCTLLLDASGKVIKEWDGFPQGDVLSFTEEVKKLVNADNR